MGEYRRAGFSRTRAQATALAPHSWTQVPLSCPEGGAAELLFIPADHVSRELGVVVGEGAVSAACPHVWVHNPGSHGIELSEGTQVGVFRPCEALSAVQTEEALCNFEDAIGDSKLGPTCLDTPAVEDASWCQQLLNEASFDDPDQRMVAEEMLLRHRAVFSLPGDAPGCCVVTMHQIDTGDALPIKQAYRGLPYAKREEAARQIRKMLEAQVIEKSSSTWASPIVWLRKKTARPGSVSIIAV